VSVRRDAVTGVEVVGNAVRMVGPEPAVVARFRRPADAKVLAAWLAERLNVGTVVPPSRP
jgi:ribosomal protein L35AE/L33A